MKAITIVLLLAFATPFARAHHSFSATFDPGRIVELEGQVTRVLWRNPHVRLSVRANRDGAEWEIETHSVSILSRMEIEQGAFRVGDTIRLAGHPSRRPVNDLFALHALLENGQEVVFDPRLEPRWGTERIGSGRYWVAPASESDRSDNTIFRVWSTVTADPGSFPLFPEGFDPSFDIESYPLTAAARASLADFDPLTDTPTLDCAPKGMPTIMEQPYPMEFIDRGDTIVLRLEEYDTIRTIHLNASGDDSERPRSLLGYSVGRWEGETLVVTTTRVDWPHFDTVGIPLSGAAEIVERFTLNTDGSRLIYRLEVSDPATFTEPVLREKYWLAVPGVAVEPYECTN